MDINIGIFVFGFGVLIASVSLSPKGKRFSYFSAALQSAAEYVSEHFGVVTSLSGVILLLLYMGAAGIPAIR